MSGFAIDNLFDIKSFSMALTKTTTSDIGIILPIVVLEYAKTVGQGAIGLGGTTGMIAQGALSAFIKVLEVNMIHSKY